MIGSTVLRITADKSSAEYAADDVEQLLKETESKTFHLQPWLDCIQAGSSTQILTQGTLRKIGKLSGTRLQMVSDSLVCTRSRSSKNVLTFLDQDKELRQSLCA